MTSNNNFSLLQTIRVVDNNIGSEVSYRTAADIALGERIDDEINDRDTGAKALEKVIGDEITDIGNADTALGERIDDEITDRGNADTALGGRFDVEVSRVNGLITSVSKIGFISTGEAEGDLTNGEYPFCFGKGGPSKSFYGLPIPFMYSLDSIAYV
jgi:hypothetical protein